MKKTVCFIVCVAFALPLQAQVFLSGNSYSEDFNNLGSGLPNGWSIYTGATSSDLGSAQIFDPAKATWAGLGVFKNCASANNPGVTASDSSTKQDNYVDRVLGVRQTDSFGDPGAAFVFRLENTLGFGSFTVSLDCQMLKEVETRTTTWTLDYRVGSSGSFTSFATYPDPGVFGSSHLNHSFGSALDNQADPVFIRVTALDVSDGSSYRDSIGIDNLALSFSAVPEVEEYGVIAALGLLGFAAIRRFKLGRSSRLGTRAQS